MSSTWAPPTATTALLAALERAVAFSRWRAADVRSILATNGQAPSPDPRRPSTRADLAEGANQIARGLQDRRRRVVMTAASPPPLPADLTEGLKRLKMAAMRRLAPELLVTAKTQTVEARGVPPHAGRGRDRRQGRIQRPHQAQAGCVPGHQDPGRVRRQGVLGPGRDVRLPRIPGMDPGHARTCA